MESFRGGGGRVRSFLIAGLGGLEGVGVPRMLKFRPRVRLPRPWTSSAFFFSMKSRISWFLVLNAVWMGSMELMLSRKSENSRLDTPCLTASLRSRRSSILGLIFGFPEIFEPLDRLWSLREVVTMSADLDTLCLVKETGIDPTGRRALSSEVSDVESDATIRSISNQASFLVPPTPNYRGSTLDFNTGPSFNEIYFISSGFLGSF